MSDDVLITPASRKIEFKDSAGNVDGKIELDSNGNLNITSPGGDIGIGDTTADVFIGDGTNNVDIVFEQNGEIRALTGRTLTLGQSDSDVAVAAQNCTVTGTLANRIVGNATLMVQSDTDTTPIASLALMRGTDDTFGGGNDNYVDWKLQNGYGRNGNAGGTLSILDKHSGTASDYFIDISQRIELLKDVSFEQAIREKAYNLTGTALDPSNGTLQYKTLGSNTTFTETFVDGESITLMIDDGNGYTVTWPTMTWASGSAPTLATSGYTTVVLWHRSSLYGAVVG